MTANPRRSKSRDPRVYDFAVACADASSSLFVEVLRKRCSEEGFSFRLIDKGIVRNDAANIARGTIRLRVLLDMASDASNRNDMFYALANRVSEAGGRVINDPYSSYLATDRVLMHFLLQDHGFKVPYTVFVPSWDLAPILTENRRKALGQPIVVKPARGLGPGGVVKDTQEISKILKAGKASLEERYLLQEKVRPKVVNGQKAWFRLFCVMDKVFPFWWNYQQGTYEEVTEKADPF